MNTYTTTEVAKIIGIHPNTVRMYEEWGLIPLAERKSNGYRVFTDFHIEQLKFARIAFRIEVLQNGLRKKVVEIIKLSANRDFDKAIMFAEEYRNQLQREKRNAEESIGIAKQILSGKSVEQTLFLKRKEVSATNVMGATKRMCEMIVQSTSTYGNVKYSATRFGNVLGSAGSVIPLFKKQIANGGPITITDKRIIRYFMTIPEASQLVLQSGAMAKNGEIFVLDMGQPVKIIDLAENMIKLSGVHGIEIVETGLRPGEKLYEELLVKTEELDKTSNDMIFIERDKPLDKTEVDLKLEKLQQACLSGDDDVVRNVLRDVVPTFKDPETVNKKVSDSGEKSKEFVLA